MTPFLGGGLDGAALGPLCERQIKGSTSALVVCGSTGEAASLSAQEHARVVGIAVEAVGGRVPVIAGCGAPSTEAATILAANAVLRASPSGPVAANPIQPFEGFWSRSRTDLPTELLPAEDSEALRAMPDSLEALAFSLANAMNNTSVVTLFRFGGRNLLFPGDAQYGNWQSWIDDPSATAILESVDFYKVAHHGSVNATPKSALEGMAKGRFAAMISTHKPWPSIPWGNLLQALIERSCGVARSDAISVPSAPFSVDAPPPIFTQGPIWCDCAIPV